jgi:hypothetical protein
VVQQTLAAFGRCSYGLGSASFPFFEQSSGMPLENGWGGKPTEIPWLPPVNIENYILEGIVT